MKPLNPLSASHPQASLLWDYSKNRDLDPDQVSASSPLIVWWLCVKSHSWQVSVRNLVLSNSPCPYCSGRKPLKGFTDFGTSHPEAAKQWHPSKNEALQPENFFAGSNKKMWWQCEKGHEWKTAIYSVTLQGTGCGYCSGRRLLAGFNDLATMEPDIAKKWHPTKNESLQPSGVTTGSNRKVWWQCEKGHEWEAIIASVARKKTGCLYCSGLRILDGFNDLATLLPETAKKWHPTKNENLKVTQVGQGSSKTAWWVCSEGHEWEAVISSIASGKTGCIYCSGRGLIKGWNDLATTDPFIAAKWHPSKNEDLTPSQVKRRSNKKVWWKCSFNHEWEALISTQSDTSCPYCYGRYVITGENDLATRYPETVKEWHPTKNGDLTPQNTMPYTPKQIWWRCDEGHEWEASPNTRFSKGAYAGCSYCSGTLLMEGFNDLATTHPEIAKEWHPTKNKEVLPTHIKKSSEIRYWWLCLEDHEWQAGVYSRAVMGTGCAICSGMRLNPGVTDLQTLNSSLSSQWHPTKNGDLFPNQVTAFSSLKVWWKCSKGHEWEASINNRNKGKNCSRCTSAEKSSKAEKELSSYVESLGVKTVLHTRKILMGKELDIYVPDKKIAIEYNGIYWHTEESGKFPHYHYDKWKDCQGLGIDLIQVWEDDWNRSPDLVKAFIAYRLGMTDEVMSTVISIPEEVSEIEANEFFNTHHIHGGVSANIYYGLRDNDRLLLAVLAVDKQVGEGLPEIVRFCSSESPVQSLQALLSGIANAFQLEDFIVKDDHSYSDSNLWESQGFVRDLEVAPDFMYFYRKARHGKESFTLDHFRDDPRLLFTEGLTIGELAILNGFRHVWDCGATIYKKQK